MAIGEIEIASYTYQELAAAWGADMTGIDGPIDGTFYATGEFGNPPYEGPAQYQDMEITLPWYWDQANGLQGKTDLREDGFRWSDQVCMRGEQGHVLQQHHWTVQFQHQVAWWYDQTIMQNRAWIG
jgi:hypothetical protein